MQNETPWFVKDLWNTSPLCFSDEIRNTMPYLPKRVHFREAMREAEENGAVGFHLKDKIPYTFAMAEIGVSEIDMGMASHPYQLACTKAVRKALDTTSLKMDLMLIVRGNNLKEYAREIDLAVKNGANVVDLYGLHPRPGITSLIKDIMKWSNENTPSNVIICPAIQRIAAEDVSSLQDRVDLARTAIDAAGEKEIRINVYDSLAQGTPAVNKYICEKFREEIGDIDMLFHAHNEFGLATACALGAVEGGANMLDTTVNGLGDRAGNSSFEEVVMALKCLYGVETGIKTEQLYSLSKLVEKWSGVKVQWHKAVVGDFAWREDLHTRMLLPARKAGEMWKLQVYNPNLVGQRHRLVFGKTVTSPPTIKWKLDDMGLKYTDEDVELIVWAAMKEIDRRIEHGEDRFLLEHELDELCRKVLIENSKLKKIQT